MPILRNHSCGHVQRFCPRCFATGCEYTSCSESIGDGSAMICKVCGCNEVISMENHQTKLQARKRESERNERATQTRLKNLEQATNTRYVGTGYTGASYSGTASLFNIKTLVFLGGCYGLSHVLKFSEVDGILAIPVGFINLVGGFVSIALKLLVKLIEAMG